MTDAGFTVLSALAAVPDIESFRLRELMAQLGIDTRQPVLFYRALIAELRQAIPLIDEQYQQLVTLEKANAQAEAKMSSLEQEAKALRARTTGLQAENSRIAGLVSQAEENSTSYEALKLFLAEQTDATILKALIDLLWDVYYSMQIAKIQGQPPPDPARLSAIRHQLREALMESLEIPRPALEMELIRISQELQKAKEQVEALKGVITTMTSYRR